MIPYTIVDNFFKEPEKIVQYAKSLTYDIRQKNYPGVRADIEDKKLKQEIHEKIMSLFFDLDKERIEWDTSIHFQKTSKDDIAGWIHQDIESIITCIVYLSDNENEGTSIYELKDKKIDITKIEKDYISPREEAFLDKNKILDQENKRLEWNNYFKETLYVPSKYNRLFAFFGPIWHGVPKFISDERLTLTFFTFKLTSITHLPLVRVNSRVGI